MEPKFDAFLTRHSKKPKGEDVESPDYPGVSESGVELAKERAKELLEMIEKSEPGSVVFIGGASELVRTRSAGEIYGDEIDELTKDRQDEFLVITRDMISEMAHGSADKLGLTVLVGEIKRLVDENKDKKVVIDFPMFLKEFGFSGENRWGDRSGKLNDYTKNLLAKNNNDELATLKEWIATGGKMEGEQVGPDPMEVAESHIKGIKRLQKFASKFIPDRPLTIGMAGHSWNLDVMAVYLANDGKIDSAGFEKVGGGIIKETEPIEFKLISENKAEMVYRGKEYELTPSKQIE